MLLKRLVTVSGVAPLTILAIAVALDKLNIVQAEQFGTIASVLLPVAVALSAAAFYALGKDAQASSRDWRTVAYFSAIAALIAIIVLIWLGAPVVRDAITKL